MLINWFTVIAQAINFLILVWLLKRFLYQPVLNAIDAREKKIADRLSDAQAKMSEAEKERDDFQQKNAVFDREREELLGKAVAEAKAVRQRMLEDARKEVTETRAGWQSALQKEQDDLAQEMKRRAQEELFSIARKALSDLASESLEQNMVRVFLSRFRAMSDEEKKSFCDTLAASPGTILVRSALGLPKEQQAEITAAVKEISGKEFPLRFETKPEEISGVELVCNGYKFSWNINDYLETLEKSVNDIVKSKNNSKSDGNG